MNRVLLGILLVTLFISCGKSKEYKVDALIEENIKKVLYHPDAYDPVETQVDSAFTPFDDPIFYEKATQLGRLGVFIGECDEKMKSAKTSMSMWSGPYQSAFGRNEYQEAKDEYEENARNKNSAEIKSKKLVEELRIMLDKEQNFIGFKARHRYRAKSRVGLIVFGEIEVLFDKDINNIVALRDMDDDEYKAVQLLYKQMLGEDVQIEDNRSNYIELFEE